MIQVTQEPQPGIFSPGDGGSDAIAHEIDRCAAILPPMPAILLRLEKELASEWVNVTRLGNLVRTDPALTAGVLKVANSPLMRGGRQISEIDEAIQRLGKDNLRALATVLSLRQGAFPLTGLLGASMAEFWRHSLLVAAGAVQIVRGQTSDHETLEQVWTAGLLHDLGALLAPLLYAPEFETVTAAIAALEAPGANSLIAMFREGLGIDHARIGGVFAERGWKLSSSVAALVGYWPDPESVEPAFAAWAIHRADQMAQVLGVCWQPVMTRATSLEVLDPDSGAAAACDPAFCRAALERHLPLVDALLSA